MRGATGGGLLARMGFAKPKAYEMPVAAPAPPPVRQTAAEVQYAADAQRKLQAARKGYAATLLAPAAPSGAAGKKTLLG